MWLIMIKEISLFIYCPHLIFAGEMLFVPLQLHLHGNVLSFWRCLKVNEKPYWTFGWGREKGEISWKISLCFPALINLHKSISHCRVSKVSYSRPETDVCESWRDHVFSGWIASVGANHTRKDCTTPGIKAWVGCEWSFIALILTKQRVVYHAAKWFSDFN